MTKLTFDQKKELLGLLSRPMRYGELRLLLLDYIKKTAYQHMNSFEDALRRDNVLVSFNVKMENGRVVTLYCSSPPTEINPHDVAFGLCPKGYFCNTTSVYFHGLTNQVPKSIYVAMESLGAQYEQARKGQLTNHDIFASFVKAHRHTKNACKFRDHVIFVTERVNRGDPGVNRVATYNRICPKGSRVTSLERALIDAVVHPHYNGGISSVVEFYRAGAKRMNPTKLLKVYKALNFKYPYWQAIGFLCEKVGADRTSGAIADSFKARNKFYLDHLAKDSWAFNSKWQIHYPKGILE